MRNISKYFPILILIIALIFVFLGLLLNARLGLSLYQNIVDKKVGNEWVWGIERNRIWLKDYLVTQNMNPQEYRNYLDSLCKNTELDYQWKCNYFINMYSFYSPHSNPPPPKGCRVVFFDFVDDKMTILSTDGFSGHLFDYECKNKTFVISMIRNNGDNLNIDFPKDLIDRNYYISIKNIEIDTNKIDIGTPYTNSVDFYSAIYTLREADIYYIIWDKGWQNRIDSTTKHIETNLTRKTIKRLFPYFKGEIIHNTDRVVSTEYGFKPDDIRFYQYIFERDTTAEK